MKIEIDPHAGFCFGVTRVVNKAEEIIRQHGFLYCLGEIVHNQKEIERLEKLGLKTITYKEYQTLSNCRVLIRAHGEPPETYQYARENNIDLIDGTCPIVLRLQSRIKDDHQQIPETGAQIVIFGKKDHAEVRGLAGQTGYKTIIIDSTEDFDRIDFAKPVHLYAQTTMSMDKYRQLESTISKRMSDRGLDANLLKCTHSICRQVSGRIQKLQEFCMKHDAILFVSYKQSSNGKLLFSKCKEVNPKAYFVSEIADIKPDMLWEINSLGITGATSTPAWLLEEFAQNIGRNL